MRFLDNNYFYCLDKASGFSGVGGASEAGVLIFLEIFLGSQGGQAMKRASQLFLVVFGVLCAVLPAWGQQINFSSNALAKVTFDESPAVDEWPAAVQFSSSPSGLDISIVGPEVIGSFFLSFLPSFWAGNWDCERTVFSLASSGGEELIDFPSSSTLVRSWSIDLFFSFGQAGDQCPSGVEGRLTLEFDYSGVMGSGKVVVSFSPPLEACIFEGEVEDCPPPPAINARFEVWPSKIVLKKGGNLWAAILPATGFNPDNLNLSTIRLGPAGIKPCAWRVKIGKKRAVALFVPDVTRLGLKPGDTRLYFRGKTFAGATVEGYDAVTVKNPCVRR